MTSNKLATVREAIGIFHNADSLRDAIDDLRASGFKTEEMGLLATEQVVEQSLGELYARTNDDPDSPESPVIVGRDSIGEAPRIFAGSLFFVGTCGAVAAVVASLAVFGGAVLAAIGGIVGVAVIGVLVVTFIHQSDTEYLQQQVDEGYILLFVRIDSAHEQQAMNILKQNSGLDVKMYDVPVKSSKAPNAPEVVNA